MSDGRIVNGVPVPTSPEEMAELAADNDLWAKVTETPEIRAEFLTAYNAAMNKAGKLADQLEESISAGIIDQLKEWGVAENKVDFSELTKEIRSLKPGARDKGYNPRALGAQLDDMYDNPADFFKDIWHLTNESDDLRARHTRLKNAFSEKVPSEGGFLVPEQLRSDLLRVAIDRSIVRPRARVVPMDSLRVPFPMIDSTSNATSVYGGIVAYWTEEGGTMTDVSPKFGRLVLEAKKLTAYTEVPNELVSDSISSFAVFIEELFPEALAHFEDVAFFGGSGAGEPQGFQNAACSVDVAKRTGQAATTIVWENLVDMYSRMLPGSLDRAVWVAHIDTFPELATMALSVGTGGSAIWLNNGVEGPPMTILGRPVIFTEKMETVGTLGDIAFVDFGYYLIGDRQVMTASSSPHFKFQTDLTAYKIIQRVDGKMWLQSAITPETGSSTMSPLVRLATRA